jgi:hypothetical protein
MKPAVQPRSLAEGSAINASFWNDLITRTIKLVIPFTSIETMFRGHAFEGQILNGLIGPVILEFQARVTLLTRPQEHGRWHRPTDLRR